MQLDLAQGRGQRGAHRTRAAAQVDDDNLPLDGGRRRPGGARGRARAPGLAGARGLADEELGATAGDEYSRADGYPQATEVRPADDMFEGRAGDPLVHHGVEVGRRACRGDEQPRLVLREDAAGRAEPGDDDGLRAR